MLEIDRPYHPVSALFPMMTGDEYEDLRADVAANGLLEPIWLHPDGSIIDGRNRHRACIETGTNPTFRTWAGGGSLVSFVVSLNLKRRHLTSSQRAAVAVDILPMLAEEARERQRMAGEQFGRGQDSSVKELTELSKPHRATEQAAVLFQTNRQYVSDAKQLQERAPDLLDEVRSGEKTIPQARRELNNREKIVRPLPLGTFRVLYADPPWKYDNSGFDQSAAAHYPTMATEDVCALPVGNMAADESVLFLWVTNPFLEDGLKVLRAWGFEYKTNLVWVKDRGPTIGWFVQGRHELLLIGTKGSGVHPKERPLSIIHGEVTVHSRKPDSVYGMIEAMYDGPCVELFARQKHSDAWEVWGNEQ